MELRRSIAAFFLLALAVGCEGPADPEPRPVPDTVAPAVEILFPAADTTYPSQAGVRFRRVRGVATDSVGVSRVSYRLEGREEVEVPVTPGTSAAFSFELHIPEGTSSLVVHAFDAAGNRGTSNPRRLTEDTRGPVLRSSTPGDSARLRNDSIRVTAIFSDPAGIAWISHEAPFRLSGGATFDGDTLVRYTFTIPLQGGANRIDLSMRDRLGNRSYAQIHLFREGLAFRTVSRGAHHACALSPAGEPYCMGERNSDGQLGNGTTGGPPAVTPGPVATTARFSRISAGGSFTCALDPPGRAFCWGANTAGQLGVGSHDWVFAAPRPVSGEIPFRVLSSGGAHACAISTAGELHCWGNNEDGQVSGTAWSHRVPVRVGAPATFGAVSAGGSHSCAIGSDGTARCWGANESGQLGVGDTLDRREPTPVAGGIPLVGIGAGAAHSCGLAADGSAYCWGSNLLGELGTGSYQTGPSPFTTPQRVAGGRRFSEITVGRRHSCGLDGAGRAWCWGDNVDGQLGTGNTAGSPAPVAVEGGLVFQSLSAGGTGSCGVTTAERLYCWGDRKPLPTLMPGQ